MTLRLQGRTKRLEASNPGYLPTPHKQRRRNDVVHQLRFQTKLGTVGNRDYARGVH